MKYHRTLIASLVLATAVAGTVYAQGPGCEMMGGQGGPGGRQGGVKFDPAQRAEQHLGQFKNQLKITAEQEPLWQAYAEKMKAEAGKGMQAMRATATDTKLSAPERMAKRQGQMEEHLVAMKGVHEGFSRLYAGLTPEQKAIADQHVAHMGQGMGKKGGPRRGTSQPQG
jgi:hypothetical protein